MEDLKSGRLHSRRYRNRRIGEFLKELDLTEGRGTGIPKVQGAMEKNGSPPAEFATNDDRDYFTAILPIHPALQTDDLGGDLGGDSLPPPKRTPQQQIASILSFCQIPRTRVAVQKFVGLRDNKHFRERYLTPLLEENLLIMTEPDKPRSRNQNYHTTAKGWTWLKENAPDFEA